MSKRSRVQDIHDPAYGLPTRNPFGVFEQQISEEKNQITELKALITRAADALEGGVCVPEDWTDLIADLRKAVE